MPVSLIRVRSGGHPKNKKDRTFTKHDVRWEDVITALRNGDETCYGTQILYWKYKRCKEDDPACPKERSHALRWNRVKRGGDDIRRFMVHLGLWPFVRQPCQKAYHSYLWHERVYEPDYYG